MKIPYGESSFKKIRTGDYLYIDKTAYIAPLEEEGCFNILLRPRRFGKSLFLSTLWHYYDVHYQDQFGSLFSGLAIGEAPTPLRNSYQVLFMEFSGIRDNNTATILEDFLFEIRKRLRIF
ncbi:MAG: AAA family ATPase [Candidatus Electrothrix sp. GW3-4]|uniref:AAA family ATPase n=1 Tax=Candidatus Electrothrix sp. GW3-4 TaxID=3126740 RepID=UPI0030CDE646